MMFLEYEMFLAFLNMFLEYDMFLAFLNLFLEYETDLHGWSGSSSGYSGAGRSDT
jgi:hypothetical protein